MEAEKHADGFEDRGFTLRVLADDAGPAWPWMEIQRLEAAEAAQTNLGDHAGDSARPGQGVKCVAGKSILLCACRSGAVAEEFASFAHTQAGVAKWQTQGT